VGNTGLVRRLAAILYDTLLVAALLFFATIPFIALNRGEAVETTDNLLYRAALVLVTYLFFVGYWTKRGRTLGMQSWELVIENDEGRLPSLQQASIRFFAAILSWLLLGLGFFWQLWDPDRLTWHDRLSGTRLLYLPRKKRDQRAPRAKAD
jgi:uncharacterized RDD family membrane protein YckC